ncbi:helix-turn-helix domain-containing protein [Salinivibrio sharmensis]|uniref:HTH cro/C1-type domain-containing protein n=1 Tax=Salinivibrio sharmensis TaxID=390883 RepID=A0ABX3KI83_9GAMM|nr:helix-turn-helix transcriptional regulator [Salinivibrio sharmensis]OOE88995.1 hypothetical protein BZG74_07050 [Salinivibrio sharmensis]
MSLGQSLRRLRENKGITLAALAERVDSHVGNLSRIERDKARPSLDLLYKIAEALDYQLTDVFQHVEECRGNVKQSALNAIFITLLEQDQDLLLEFAQLLKKRNDDCQQKADSE